MVGKSDGNPNRCYFCGHFPKERVWVQVRSKSNPRRIVWVIVCPDCRTSPRVVGVQATLPGVKL